MFSKLLMVYVRTQTAMNFLTPIPTPFFFFQGRVGWAAKEECKMGG